MVEYVGAAAAVSQLAKYGLSTANSVPDFVRRVKKAPVTQLQWSTQLSLLTSLSQEVHKQSVHSGAISSTILSHIADELSKISPSLRDTEIDADDGRLARMRKKIRVVGKETDINKDLAIVTQQSTLCSQLLILRYINDVDQFTTIVPSSITSGALVNPSFRHSPDIATSPGDSYLLLAARNPNFVGQVDLLSILLSKMKACPRSTIALSGLGGMGKSEVALELAYMLQETLPDMSVIWLDASTKTSLYKGLERFHRHTRHAQPHQDAVFDITAVYSWLDSSMYGARLLVLDNADLAAFSEPILHGLLKQREQVHLLITTRNRLFALEHVHPIDLTEMPVMTVEAGGELLSSYAGSENVSSHHETGQLISYLESCPFALKRIGSHMRATGNGVGAYLAIAQHGPSFLTSLLTGPHDSQQNPIIREDSFEWLYSVNTLTAQSRDAIPVLLVLSCICSSEICEEILDALADTESKRYALDVLRSYSLLRPTKSGKTWDVPCLVALAAKAQLYHHPNRTGYLGDALWIVVSVGSSRKDLTLTPPHYWAHAASLLKTYVHLTTEDELDLGTMEAIIQLGIRLCRYLVAGARAAEAVLTLRQLILWASNRARNLVPSFDKLRCKLGTALHSDGHYADAEEETRQVLRSQILTIGEDDTNTLHSLNNLGVYHHDQSRFPMAESFHRKALQMKRAKFGTHHVETLVTLNNLALSLQSQKKLAEAELFFSQALRGRKRLLSAYHADTLVSVSNLGVLKQLQGQLKQSRRLHEAALSGREQTLGAEHPETLKSRGNVALLLQHEGHYDQAIEMLLEVRQTQRVAVGRCHPDTIKSSKNLAIMLHQQNKFSDAETVASELLEVLEERHGKGHPETFATSQHLATLLHWQGKLEEAFDIVAWLYDMRSELFGVDHPDTISSREYLAEIESELTCSGQGSSVVILSMI